MIEIDYELEYFDEVEDDIEIAKLWYYEQNPDTDLEERFAHCIKETIDKLQKNPFIYYPIFENIRIAQLLDQQPELDAKWELNRQMNGEIRPFVFGYSL
jgi:hypothetical protein